MMNKEGLTWKEWAYAALPPDSPKRAYVESPGSHQLLDERRAWRAGEDPTEWRAST